MTAAGAGVVTSFAGGVGSERCSTTGAAGVGFSGCFKSENGKVGFGTSSGENKI